MRKRGVGKYSAVEGELIQIRFFCSPQRENVNIRASYDGTNFVTIPGNSIQFQMETGQITLRIQYAFINQGTCLNQILVVENSPTADDRVTVGAGAGEMDFIALIFTL